MSEQFSRTQLIYGKAAMEKLASSRVAVFGVGGVGGYVVEALARSGVGALDLIDNDTVCVSNINRQIIATFSSIGKYKVDAAKERIHDINPDCVVRTYKTFYLPDTAGEFDFREYDYIVDAIDTVTGKIAIIENANAAGTPVISSMGAGNKTDPSAFEVADIYETSVCPLAKVMRRELKKRGIKSLKVVYSKETALIPLADTPAAGDKTGRALPENGTVSQEENSSPQERPSGRRSTPGSVAFVPSAAGLIIAGEIVNDLTRDVFRK